MLFQSYISASLTLLSPLSPPPSLPLYRFHLHLPPTCPLLFFTSPSFQRYKAKSKGLQKFRFLHTTPTFMEWYGADFQTGTAMLFHLISINTNSANLFSATSAYFRGITITWRSATAFVYRCSCWSQPPYAPACTRANREEWKLSSYDFVLNSKKSRWIYNSEDCGKRPTVDWQPILPSSYMSRTN